MHKLSPLLALIGALICLAASQSEDAFILLVSGASVTILGAFVGFFVKAPSIKDDVSAKSESEPEPAAVPPVPELAPRGIPTDSLVLMSLLQEKGRFLDFLMDDISAYPDPQVGAAARVIHQGCKTVISNTFAPVPVSDSSERSVISLEPGFDKSAYRISGELAGEPPHSVTLEHKGWKPTQCVLPEFQGQLSSVEEYIFAPAQVSAR